MALRMHALRVVIKGIKFVSCQFHAVVAWSSSLRRASFRHYLLRRYRFESHCYQVLFYIYPPCYCKVFAYKYKHESHIFVPELNRYFLSYFLHILPVSVSVLRDFTLFLHIEHSNCFTSFTVSLQPEL